MSPLQADEIFACLNRHGVRYVVTGGLAAVLRGSPLPTLDVDICPAEDPSNLERLAAALEEMDARVRTPDSPHGVRFPRDAAFLGKVELLHLVTRYGDLDLAFRPSGTAGYSAWVPGATEMVIGHLRVVVAGLPDVIRSKEAANRAKDQRTLPVLRQLPGGDPEARERARRGSPRSTRRFGVRHAHEAVRPSTAVVTWAGTGALDVSRCQCARSIFTAS